LYAIGPSVSILMDGYVDSRTGLVSLRGTMVPAKTLNKFISKLPLLGDILIPKEIGEGLFGISFKMKGTPDKIKTTVNPIKTLTPRFIQKALKKSGNFSFTQGAICRNNKILTVEGSGGTQKMIKKVKKITKFPNGILIKFPKKRQDLRVDLPTVGLETLKQCKMAGLKGIVLKHKLNIFLNKSQSVQYANRNKMFILIK